MSSSQNLRNLPPKEVLDTIRKCLREANEDGKNKFARALKQRRGKLAELRYYLFVNPGSITVFSLLLVLSFLGILLVASGFAKIFYWVCIALALLYPFCSLIPLLLGLLTPKFEIEWNELFSVVLKNYLEEKEPPKKQVKQAKSNIRRAILYYSRRGQPLKFSVNLLYGSIFIGCLPDKEFQNALINFSVNWSLPLLFEANIFGTSCMLISLFLYPIYHYRYELPVIWMESVITQIELREEEEE